MSLNYRLLGPITAATTVVNGRTYTGAPGNVYDVVDGDGDVLGANRWVKVCPSGPTSSRPTISMANGINFVAQRGVHFMDTTIGKLIVFDGATWRDPTSGTSV